MSKLQVLQGGYNDWITQPRRRESDETDFGVQWGEAPGHNLAAWGPRWRVSWIEDTGELYAVQHITNNLIILGH